MDFEVSAATVSHLIGGALLKLGLARRASGAPLAVVLAALRHSGIIEMPAPRFVRFEHDGRVHLELSLPVLSAETLNELSHCERQVALMIAWGFSYREIGALRGIAHSTVANQIGSLSKKLRVRGRFELIRCWADRQWRARSTH
jgi:DNA-binding CsgD family transcriptional regulator